MMLSFKKTTSDILNSFIKLSDQLADRLTEIEIERSAINAQKAALIKQDETLEAESTQAFKALEQISKII